MDIALLPVTSLPVAPPQLFEPSRYTADDDDVCFILDQHAEMNFYSASSLKQQSGDRHVASLGHIILIPSQPVVALSP